MKLKHTNIVSNTEIAPDIFSMVVHAPEISAMAHAGQFAMIYMDKGELLLPRPISICDTEGENVRFVYQVVGAGTKVMAKMQAGTNVKMLAPLGKGFFTASNARTSLKNVAIVGGGIGTPPLLLLAKTLKAQGATVDAYLGFRQHPILESEFEAVADSVRIATEVGNTGHRGNILEVLQALHTSYDEILACGPRPMLNALADYAHAKNIPCQISTEERMACGLGTCVGCVLKVQGSNVRICTEGPVFYSDEVTKHE